MDNALKIMLASALITAAALKAAPALAEPRGAGTAVSVVRTSDLNLASAAGQRQLDIRLSHAAREVCGTASESDLGGRNDVRKCRGDVLAKARAVGRSAASARPGMPIAVIAAR